VGAGARDRQGLRQGVGSAKNLGEGNRTDLAQDVVAHNHAHRNGDTATRSLEYEFACKSPRDQSPVGKIWNRDVYRYVRGRSSTRRGNAEPGCRIRSARRRGPIQGSGAAISDLYVLTCNDRTGRL